MKKTNKIWLLPLCLCLAVIMLPIKTFAAAPTVLYVNGTDILTAADHTVACGSGTAVYDSGSNTLILTNAVLEEPYNLGAIYSNGDLTIKVVGENTIDLVNKNTYGFQINGGSVTITSDGNGFLKINQPVRTSNGDITVDNSRLEINSPAVAAVNAYQQGTTTGGTVTIQNNANVTVNGGAGGIYAYGNVVVSASSLTVKAVHATANELGIYAMGEIRISGSTITAEVPADSPYQSILGNSITILENSDVTAIGGIRAYGDITITPANGSKTDVKVGSREDGENGTEHFKDSPYSASATFTSADGLSSYTYTHIKEHTHIYDKQIVSGEHIATAATCKEAATYYYSCICGANGTKTFESGLAAGHQLTLTAKKEATCTTDGKEAYYTCDICNKYFSDENGQNEIPNLDEYGIITATSHSFAWVTGKESTATEAGLRYEECTICGYKKNAVEIPATGTIKTTESPFAPGQSKETPSTTDNTTNAMTTAKIVPATGDRNSATLWIALFLLTFGAITGIIVSSRKRKAS
jgi:hypothetical protein